ncbi:hypothetical protein V2J09_000856 [Rumex salicifolius]
MINQVRNARLPLMNLVQMKGVPILNQLHLEERLLRASSDNWCIINDGTNEPTVVMGISGKPAELLDVKSILLNQIPVVRRFTGGGTVIVDHETVFVTFICNKDSLPDVQPYPRPIMSWSEILYNEVFHGVGDFKLRENDYVFGDHKFGGNAQSITKCRWIHHTSFLWDYNVSNMIYLKVPARAPKYRMARNHLDFVCRMKEYLPRSSFIDRTILSIGSHFSLKPITIEEIEYGTTAVSPSSTPLTKADLEATIITDELPTLASQSLQ